jgi:glycosyltransferase involved in cell wall biosynthesis
MDPLVSILIPAYNAENWIADTIRSAIAQTWPRKEIIVVDDGSSDRTAEVARAFASKKVAVIFKERQGAAAARNHALQFCQGDYIQWLDADDILAPDKIQRQLTALRKIDNRRTLLSSAWACFYYRTRRARFVMTSLWQDLSPIEWLVRRMSEGLYMQTATWLTSRELTQAVGPWDTRLFSDDDVEYFCRVLLASQGTHFVPEARVFYRNAPSSRLSYIGASHHKKEALLLSFKLQVQHIRSAEDSERVRKSCLVYAQNCLNEFYPERPDLVAELEALAEQLGGALSIPRLRPKYSWMESVMGRKVAKSAQIMFPQLKGSLVRCWDKAMHRLENLGSAVEPCND